MTLGSSVDAEQFAAMIVAAVERAERSEQSLGLEDLLAAVPGLLAAVGPTNTVRTLVVASRRCADTFVETWLSQYPEDQGPISALRAVDSWIADPGPEAAAYAASFSSGSLESLVRSKGSGPSSAWPDMAWFARSCAWLADAPQFGWQAVAVLHGLMRAAAKACLLQQLSATIAEASVPTT